MKATFIEIPIYEYLYRKTCRYTHQLVNTNYIVRMYQDIDNNYNEDCFIEINKGNQTLEILRVALSYSKLTILINS